MSPHLKEIWQTTSNTFEFYGYNHRIYDWLVNDCNWDYVIKTVLFLDEFFIVELEFEEVGGAIEFKLRFYDD